MAEIKVEKDSGGGWKWLLAALAIAGILAAVLFANMGRDEQQTGAGLYDPNAPVAAVTYEGERWVPRGDAVDYPEGQMNQVGTSPEGYALFANTEQGYTGGGGGSGEAITPGTEPQAYGRVFLKTVDGRYMPLFKLE